MTYIHIPVDFQNPTDQGWVEGSCEARRSQMSAVALRNIQGTPRRRLHAKAIYLSSKPFWKE
jgi:hypothetical protein